MKSGYACICGSLGVDVTCTVVGHRQLTVGGFVSTGSMKRVERVACSSCLRSKTVFEVTILNDDAKRLSELLDTPKPLRLMKLIELKQKRVVDFDTEQVLEILRRYGEEYYTEDELLKLKLLLS
jgi:hypothetical protein